MTDIDLGFEWDITSEEVYSEDYEGWYETYDGEGEEI